MESAAVKCASGKRIASGTDGKIYGVPKDKDNVVLVYNKEMFDAAGVSYPDESWTWDDLTDASQRIYDATGSFRGAFFIGIGTFVAALVFGNLALSMSKAYRTKAEKDGN